MNEPKINKGVELMLRGARPKERERKDEKPSSGFGITKFFTLLKRRVYFNLELWWDKEKD
jgi:hypothetical protein